MDSQEITDRILKVFPKANVTVTSEDNVHFFATVIDDGFAGMSRIQRHRQVYQAIGNDMGNAIHALALTTKTQEELL